MFKKLSRLFMTSTPEDKEIENISEDDPHPPPEEVPKPLPDIIEVPWSDAAATKNFSDHRNKIHKEIKDFLYRAKITEKKLFEGSDLAAERLKDKIRQLRELYKNTSTLFQKPPVDQVFLRRKKSNNNY